MEAGCGEAVEWILVLWQLLRGGLLHGGYYAELLLFVEFLALWWWFS